MIDVVVVQKCQWRMIQVSSTFFAGHSFCELELMADISSLIENIQFSRLE